MLLCGGLHLSLSEKLKCQFYEGRFDYAGFLYYCSVTSLDNSLNNMTIDGFTGVHITNKNDTYVRGIYIHNTNTKFIPANLGFLSQLTTLIVQK